MGYGLAALNILGGWIGEILPPNGRIMELGSQDINHDVPLDDIRRTLMKIHGDTSICEEILSEYFTEAQTWKVANLFRYSKFHYASIDAYPGEFIIQADLNTMSVSADLKNRYDLITNFGTTEHVTDQVNVFRVIHDYLKPGGYCFHTVPFAGYFNHGLYNYHPLFFLFLSHANKYQVSSLSLSPPHFEYNIPTVEWLSGSEEWKRVLFQSGIVSCMLRKIYDEPFELFTDYDRSVITDQASSNLAKALEGRYDLRVRTQSAHEAQEQLAAAPQELQPSKSWVRKWIGRVRNGFLNGDKIDTNIILSENDIMSKSMSIMYDNNYVFVYQMGKVGSTAICRSFDKIGHFKYSHCQWLRDDVFKLMDWKGSIKRRAEDHHFRVSTYNYYNTLRFHLVNLNLRHLVKVITVCREPISQFLSAFFHGGGIEDAQAELSKGKYSDNIAEIVKKYILYNCQWVFDHRHKDLSEIAERKHIQSKNKYMWYLISNPLRWFEDELSYYFDIDAYREPFPSEGWTLIDNRILILKYERFGKRLNEVIGNFIQRPDFEMVWANAAKDKDYADVYKDVLSEIKFSQEFLDYIYGSRYSRHFYSEAEINSFYKRWG